jgi:hypothetical protein
MNANVEHGNLVGLVRLILKLLNYKTSMIKHLCEQDGRTHGTVKSTRLEDVEYDVANLKKDMRDYRNLWDQVNFLQNRVSDLEKPQHFMEFAKSWIRKWLNISPSD